MDEFDSTEYNLRQFVNTGALLLWNDFLAWRRENGKYLYEILVILTQGAGAIFLAFSVKGIPEVSFLGNNAAVVIEDKFDWGIRLILVGYALQLLPYLLKNKKIIWILKKLESHYQKNNYREKYYKRQAEIKKIKEEAVICINRFISHISKLISILMRKIRNR